MWESTIFLQKALKLLQPAYRSSGSHPPVCEANPEAQYMTQDYEVSPIYFFNLAGLNLDADGGSILKAD
jgi:hypothetical protein